jgi:hypothetical protein
MCWQIRQRKASHIPDPGAGHANKRSLLSTLPVRSRVSYRRLGDVGAERATGRRR